MPSVYKRNSSKKVLNTRVLDNNKRGNQIFCICSGKEICILPGSFCKKVNKIKSQEQGILAQPTLSPPTPGQAPLRRTSALLLHQHKTQTALLSCLTFSPQPHLRSAGAVMPNSSLPCSSPSTYSTTGKAHLTAFPDDVRTSFLVSLIPSSFISTHF